MAARKKEENEGKRIGLLIRRLGSYSSRLRKEAVDEALKTPAALSPPALYALANTLSREKGRMGDAVLWYHVGRLRAVYDSLRIRNRGARKAVVALGKTVSEELKTFQQKNPGRVVKIAKQAIDWDGANPRRYDQRWAALYADVPGASDLSKLEDLMYAQKDWPEILRYVYSTHMHSVAAFADAKKQPPKAAK